MKRRRGLFQVSREKKAKLAERLRSEGLEAAGIERIPRRDDPKHRPLSFAQTRLWFLDALEPGLTAYNIPALLRLRGALDLGALASSFGGIVRRHAVLRVCFESVEGEPRQHLSPPASFELPLVDLEGVEEESREELARAAAEGSIFRPFDLGRGPLLRVLLFRLAEDEHLALLVVHHIVTDGWSMGVLIRELGELYGSFQRRQPPSLPALPLDYFDYAVWQRRQLESGPLAQQREWWQTQLEGLETLELATDSPRPPVQTFRGAVVRWRIPGALKERLETLGRERGGATLFMTLLAVFQLLLYRLSGQRDLAVGTPIANRTRRELEGLIGFFVNTLVLRGRLQKGWSFAELLDHLRKVTLAAYERQDLPFDKVVEAVHPDRDLAQAPLFQVMFALQNTPRTTLRLEGLTLESETIETTAAMFDLMLNVAEEGDGLLAALVYNADLFSATRARRLLAQLQTLLLAALESPESRLEELPLLSAAERQQILVEWNDTGLESGGSSQTLHGGFLARASTDPDGIAVRSAAGDRTYAELLARAEAVVRWLREIEIGPEDRVAVFHPRTPDLLAALLGALGSGGSYVPLDPSYPEERIAFMLSDSEVRAVITTSELAPVLPTTANEARILCLDTVSSGSQPSPASSDPELWCTTPAQESNTAYTIYTSGSTGRPKGVVIEHRSAVTLLRWAKQRFSRRSLSGVLASTSICFDLSIFEIFLPLTEGGTVILVDDALALHEADDSLLAGVTLINTVPSAMTELVATGAVPPSVEVVNLAGEPIKSRLIRDLYASTEVREVFNLYGPSEDTTYSTWALLEPADGPPPIGRPVGDTRLYLLDGTGRPLPVGVAGEIYLMGTGLARGYLDRPGTTAERFVPDPFAAEPGARAYRTGDLARFRPDGALDFLGRNDHQVKIRGYRIEPGEIEVALEAHGEVRQAVVSALGTGESRRLVAYVETSSALDEADLRGFLGETLPAHMVPASFVFLERMPLTSNGKVDRRALPEPEAERQKKPASRLTTPHEELVAAAFSEVLGHPRIERDDDFFALGGHSLLATQVVSRLRASLGVEIPLRVLFDVSTVRGLAARLAPGPRSLGSVAQLPAIEPFSEGEQPPLSFAQERMWFIDRLTPGHPAYHIASTVSLIGELDVPAFHSALAGVQARQESLRYGFKEGDSGPMLQVRPPSIPAFPVIDLGSLPDEMANRELVSLARSEALRPFDLEQGPLFRATLVRLSSRRHALFLTLHHIIADGWSMGVLLRELGELYRAARDGVPAELQSLPVSYSDFAAWQRSWLRGEALGQILDWWRDRLQGAPERLELPTDRPRPRIQSWRSSLFHLSLGPNLSHRLQNFSRQRGATLFMSLLAGFQVLLARHSGRRDVVVGSPIANRTRGEVEGLIGLFVNTLVLRQELSGNPTFTAHLDRVREATLAAYAYQSCPFEKLVETLRPKRDLGHTPLFQVMLVLQNAPLEVRLPGLRLEPLPSTSGAAKFDLTLSVIEGFEDSELKATFEYNRDLFDPATIHRLAGHWCRLLEGAIETPDQRLSRLRLLSPAEEAQLTTEWGACPAPMAEIDDLPQHLFALFATRVAERSDAVALSGEPGWQMTYGALHGRALELAARLRREGVVPGDFVGLFLERSPAQVVAMLGVLAAGGAYVPIDPAYPSERVAWIAEDSGFRLLLTDPGTRNPLPREIEGLQTVAWNLLAPDLSKAGEAPEPSELWPEAVAYVIYTSGSTGKPKGSPITHQNVTSLLLATQREFRFDAEEVFTLFHSYAFDFSIWEVWGALAWGGRVSVVSYEVSRSPEELCRLLDRERVTVLSQTPSAFQQLVPEMTRAAQADVAKGSSLQHVVFGGEALEPGRLAPWFEAFGDGSQHGAQLVNMYGITETTVHVTYRLLTEADAEESVRSPVGRSLDHLQTYLLDPHGNLVPSGVVGEIHVGGEGLGHGYLHQPSLTATRFVPSSFGPPGSRLYRSGDLARYLPSGELDFLGRLDHQVKIRGFRIELGEIESALASDPSVADVAVLALGAEVEVRLVAYLVVEGEVEGVESRLRAHLGEHLPGYMCPSAYVFLDQLPMTAHGKLDRRALPDPGGARPELETSYREAETPLEMVLCEVWAEALDVEQVGLDDNFFELGGHSLLATRIIAWVRETLEVEIPLTHLFEAPTVGGLAAALLADSATAPRVRGTAELLLRKPKIPWKKSEMERRRGLFQVSRQKKAKLADRLRAEGLESGGIERIHRRDDPEHRPLSFAQNRLWFLDALEPGLTAYNIPALLRLRGRVDLGALAASFGEILRRHAVLRVRFENLEGRPEQHLTAPAPFELPLVDLGEVAEELREAIAREVAEDTIFRPFDLGRGPLLRVLLLRLAENEHLALLVVHHIVTDGWSMGVLIRELGELYASFQRRQPPSLPSLPIEYFDYAAWQREQLESGSLSEQREWWCEQLDDLETLDLAPDQPRPPVQTFRGGVVRWWLPGELKERLGALGQERGSITLFMTLLAGFQLLLYRLSGQRDLAVGTPIANRTRRELEGLIGFFVNTLVLRGRLQRGWSFGELLDHLREVTLAAYERQDLPFDKVVEAVRPDRDLAQAPLFQVMFALQNVPRTTLRLEGLTLESETIEKTAAMFDLMLNVVEEGEGLVAGLVYNSDLFSATRAQRLMDQLRTLLLGALEAPDRRLEDLPLLSAAERQQILVEWNDTDSMAGGTSQTLHGLFAAQMAIRPDADALLWRDEHLSYAELGRRVRSLAHRLLQRGLGREEPVAICLSRSPEWIVAMLAILEAGGVYVPLDPRLPTLRLITMLEEVGHPLLLTERDLRPELQEGRSEVLFLDTLGGPPESGGRQSLPTIDPDQLAYIIFTSGSTGRPKGVQVPHRGIPSLLRTQAAAFGVEPGTRVLQFAAMGFDASILEVIIALGSGAVLVLEPPDQLLGESLLEVLRRRDVGFALLSPAVLAAVSPSDLPALTTLTTGGEAPSAEAVRRWARGRRFFNLYGPTEATIWSTLALCTGDGEAPPIGHPVLDTRVYVVDRALQPVPVKTPGELVLAGRGVVRGYRGLPSTTAGAFVPDPFGEAGGRLYRTGDLVRRRDDGQIEFLGRIDHQVKVRGFRIELGEIETLLLRLPQVREVLVTAPEIAGDRRLVAYWVGEQAGSSDSELREALARQLPDYMVPSYFVALDSMPVTRNGKIDRKALPMPADVRVESTTHVAPRSPLEQEIAEIFEELLGLRSVGVHDHFFELGGHSLLATRVMARIQQRFDVDLPLSLLFESPTVEALAQALVKPLANLDLALPELVPAAREESLPLSFGQERLWFLDQLEPGSTAYNLSLVVRLRGDLRPTALETALLRVVERHEALRCRFVARSGRPVLEPFPAQVELPRIDLTHLPAEQRQAETDRRVAELAEHGFDLATGDLLRACLIRTGPDEHLFAVAFHHIITDGWSMGIFFRDLSTFYRATVDPTAPVPAPLTIQYADFAAWQRGWLQGEILESHLAWWRESLAGGTEPLALATDFPRPAEQTFRGESHQCLLEPARLDSLHRLSREANGTLFMTLLAAFQLQLGRWSGQRQVSVGAPSAGRGRREVEELIGFFINTVVLRTDLGSTSGGGLSFRELLAQVRETTLEAFAHQEIPFEKLVAELDPGRDLSRTPLFQAFFNLLNMELPRVQLPGLELEVDAPGESPSKFDLTFYVAETPKGLVLRLVYNADLFTSERMGAFLDAYTGLLEAVAEDPDRPIYQLPLVAGRAGIPAVLEESEKQEIVAPPVAARRAAASRGEAIAVVDDQLTWTHRQLQGEAEAIARALAAIGIVRGDGVAISGARNAWLVASVLGVTSIGAVVVVLDPELPVSRVRQVVDVASPTAWLQLPGSTEALAELGEERCRGRMIRLPEDLPAITPDSPGSKVPFDVGPGDLATLTFTSGTTGIPRGVWSTHLPVASFLEVYRQRFGLSDNDRFALLAGLGHDPLQRDLWAPLVIGARLAVPSAEVLGEPAKLWRWVAEGEITVLHLTPSRAEFLLQGGPEGAVLSALRLVLFAGETLTARQARALARAAPGARLVNTYGATETPQVMAWDEILDPADLPETSLPLSIGRGRKGVEVRVVGRGGETCGVGELGEIQVRSRDLAVGYPGRAARTADRFRPDGFSGSAEEAASRVYRTGDLGRYLPDGRVVVEGRVDRQLKVRGFRVEPAEIEGMLAVHDAVERAVVVGRSHPSGDLRLVAYWTAGSGAAPIGPEELRSYLTIRLPGFAVPSVFMALESLPLTPGGKVDFSALPEPEWRLEAGDVHGRGPRTATEVSLAAVWEELLRVEALDVTEDFFALGGHSLLATRLAARIRQVFSVEMPLRQLFRTPTVEGLAAWLEEQQGLGGASAETLPPAVAEPAALAEPFPLTDIQQAYWIGRHAALELGNVATHSYLEVECPDLDLPRFEEAWNRLIERHPMLRAVMLSAAEQKILPSVPRYRIHTEDWSGLDPESAEKALAEVREAMSHQVLDPQRWPLFEIRASRLSGGRIRLHISRDALIYDAWSLVLVLRELLATYLDPGLELDPLEITFRDYVHAVLRLEGTSMHERAVRYWRERLDRLPPGPELPLAVDPQTLGTPTFERHEGGLSLAAWSRISERSRAAGISTSVALLAAWAEVLAAWSARPHFTLTLTLFNRLPVHPQVDRLVGDFTSVTLLEIEVRAGESFSDRASRIQERLWEDLDHRHVGGVWVLRELARQSRRGPSARMPVVFTSTLGLDRRPPGGQAERARDLGEVVYSITQTPQVWLDHQVSDNQDGLHFNWDSVRGLFPEGLVDAMFDAYLALLGRLARDELAWSSPGEVLTPAPQVQRRAEVNRTVAPVPAGLLHGPMLEQARRNPEAPAVISPEYTLSFGELEWRSAGLCRRLYRDGLEPGRLVAVVMHKGWEQVVAALAVLRAGGAYLPVDAALPAMRRAHLLERGEVSFAFTQEGLGEALEWPSEVQVIEVTEAEPEPGTELEPPDVPRVPTDLAYVIFTSGSTGQPKGVMIDHRGALNTCIDVNQRFDVTADDRVLGLSSLGFDLSVYDLFGVLGAGGVLVLPENDRRRDPFHWAELVQAHRVTMWNTVPALMDMYCDFLTETGAEAPSRLRVALLSGDWIPVTLPERLWRLVPDLRVISLGGATEASIWSILHPIDHVDPEWKSIPYGRPMVNQTFHVLDPAGRPRPEWVPGELYIGGIGVALGYWRDPERTAASFIDHSEHGRLYRTGDLGRTLPGGEIEFLGREDFQVKVGGHRIELGEIEAALLRCPGVKEAVAAAPGEARGPRRLVAYVVPSGTEPDPEELRRQLSDRLPEYMVPKTFVWLEALPLSANGKVDRQQLPEPEGEDRAFVAPSGEAEEQVAAAWAEVLGRDRIGAGDNFFELGGDSVMAIQATTRLAARGWRLAPTAVFEHQTVAALAPLLRPLEASEELENESIEVADEGIDLEGADLSEDDLEELLSGL